jgi:hypothetical protein
VLAQRHSEPVLRRPVIDRSCQDPDIPDRAEVACAGCK